MVSKVKVDAIESTTGSGTIALNNQFSGMTASSMPTGSVLQVVHNGTISDMSTTAASAWVASNTTLSITPSSTSSKIYITANQLVYIQGSEATLRGAMRIKRGSTVVWNTTSFHEQFQIRGTPEEISTSMTAITLDNPNTTSAITYSIEILKSSGTTMYGKGSTSGTSMTLMEIKG
jgi:hypothetical protein